MIFTEKIETGSFKGKREEKIVRYKEETFVYVARVRVVRFCVL
jgi:hypothetical protein